MSLNWEGILIAAIPGLLALVGFIYNEYRKRKNAREEADITLQHRREPTWNELVTENRNQRADINALRTDFNALEGKMDRKITAFENIVREIFNQWPADYDPPMFNAEDITELRDTNIPWKNRVRVIPGLA